MNITISTTYAVYWELRDSPNYKFTKDGKCVNSRTGKRIKMTLKNRCKGFYINGKFVAASKLRKQLIKHVPCPF